MTLDHHLHEARIVIIDDDRLNVQLLNLALRDAGYRHIDIVHESYCAARVCAEVRPDLVLLDLHMPVRDGYGVLEDLAPQLAADVYLPVIVITADTRNVARQRVLASGAKDFLTRPLSVSEVLLRAKNLLEARQLHLALRRQNEELEARVRERSAELERAQREMLRRLARAAEFRDDETGEHSERVGRLAARLASALGLAPEDVELLRLAAPLHDVGKIGVPDRVILKPGALDDAERAAMQAHSEIGARILAGSRFPLLRMAEEIALAHHEAWDGSGYPRGLSGESIPLVARIVAIADAYDAMLIHRPPRPVRSHAEALREIAAERGRQFDPRLVDVFLAMMAEEGAAVSGQESGDGAASSDP